MKMKRLLLDTNIYGLLMADKEFHLLHSKIESNKNSLKIYGLDLVRNELKGAPRKKIKGVNIQASLLRAYSSFISKEYLFENRFEDIAEKYYAHYKVLGGSLSKNLLINDFVIVACASVKDIDIVASEDNATMLSELALKAYKMVNEREGIPFPKFIGYGGFKKLLLGGTGFSNPLVNSSDKLRVFLCFFNIFPAISFSFHDALKESLIYKDFVIKGSLQ